MTIFFLMRQLLLIKIGFVILMLIVLLILVGYEIKNWREDRK